MDSYQLYQQNKRFFFESPRQTAALAKERCFEQIPEVLDAADRFADKVFQFQHRWDMEQTHTPVIFHGEIDWLHQPGADPEFVYAFNRMRFWRILGQAYALTENEKYARAFVGQMCHWIRMVRPEDPDCAMAWRSLDVGYRLVNWCKAVLCFENSSLMTPEIQQLFVRSVTEQAELLMHVWDSYHMMSNWGILANHGLFVASVVLPTTPQTLRWQAESLRRLSLELEFQVGPDGVQWEQSPQYHNEVLRCYLDVILLCLRNDIAIPEGMAQTVRAMALASCRWQKPNGFQPMMGDSDNIDQRDLITVAAGVFNDGALKFFAYPECDFDSLWDLGAAGVKQFEALEAIAPPATDYALHSSGNYIFRSGWKKSDVYLRFHCGTLGAGHGHADQLHFDLFAGGRELLCDAGRYSYVYGRDRREFKAASAHNTMTLDGREVYTCIDSWECARLSRAVNQKYYSDARYGYAEGGHLGYYPEGVFLNRRLIFLKPDVVVVADECYGAGMHTLETFFHWGPEGCIAQDPALLRYTAGQIGVRMRTLCSMPVVSEPYPSRFAPHYNQCMDNPGVRVQLKTDGFASCFHVLALDPPKREEAFTVTKLPVRSSFKGILFEDRIIEALRIEKGGRRWVLVIAHQEFATPTDTFLADGCTGFGNAVVFAGNETEAGTVLIR